MFEPGSSMATDSARTRHAIGSHCNGTKQLSIAYGMQVMAKLYRRLEAGQNIEVDMNRYLALRRGLSSHSEADRMRDVLRPNRGDSSGADSAARRDHRDCWTALTEILRHRATGSLEFVERLGRITGEMHVALAGAPVDSRLAPEPLG